MSSFDSQNYTAFGVGHIVSHLGWLLCISRRLSESLSLSFLICKVRIRAAPCCRELWGLLEEIRAQLKWSTPEPISGGPSTLGSLPSSQGWSEEQSTTTTHYTYLHGLALSHRQRLLYLLGFLILTYPRLGASKLSKRHFAGEGAGLEGERSPSARRWQGWNSDTDVTMFPKGC